MLADIIFEIPELPWPLALWDIIWRLPGAWKSARNNDKVWFVVIAILPTVGILPIIYLLTHK